MKDFDRQQTQDEGWDIFTCHGSRAGSPQLQKIDELNLWKSDQHVLRHVFQQAVEGSDYHRNTLLKLMDLNPLEGMAIVKSMLEPLTKGEL